MVYGYYVWISSLVFVSILGVEFLFWTLIRNKRTPLAPRCLVQFVLTGDSSSQHLRSKAVIGVTHVLNRYIKNTKIQVFKIFQSNIISAWVHFSLDTKFIFLPEFKFFKALEAILFSEVFSLFERLWKRHLSFKLLSRPN